MARTDTAGFSWKADSKMQIRCLGDGCKREFPSLKEYNCHDCPQPASGEVYL